MTSNNQQYRGTDAARNGGVRAFMGGMRRLASVADDKAQNGHRPVSVREASHLSLPAGLTRFLPCQTGGGFTRSRLFSIRRCAWRAANTQFSRRLVQSCAHQFRIGHEPGSNVAYPLHFLERLSSRAGFDDQQLSERPITRAQEPFAFGATDE
jgi:hypothetical protein